MTCKNCLNPGINYFDNAGMRVTLDGNCFEQEKVTFTHKQLVSIQIVYEKNLCTFSIGQDFMLGNSLFVCFKIAANADPDKYKWSDCVIVFDASEKFLFYYGSRFIKNVIIFDADMGSSVSIDNKKKDILILH